MSVGWDWQGERKYLRQGCLQERRYFESSISTSNSSYRDPILPVCISQGLSVHQLLGSGSRSPRPWAAAAGSLEPMGGDALTEGGGCTCLLGTTSGPVPQVLLANTSGDHSKARGRAGGGAGEISCKNKTMGSD